MGKRVFLFQTVYHKIDSVIVVHQILNRVKLQACIVFQILFAESWPNTSIGIIKSKRIIAYLFK